MKKPNFYFFVFILFVFGISNCTRDSDPPVVDDSLTSIPYNPQPYTVNAPSFFPPMSIPVDNSMTIEGVELGRKLFYDPILSGDSTKSCFSCHLTSGNFTDNLKFSKGINGIDGKRSSMSLENVGFFNAGLFWDGRVSNLEDQALLPIEDTLELHAKWTPDVENRLRNSSFYPTLFRKAFGIAKKSEINKYLAAKAIAQFERTLVSSGNSKYDKVLKGQAFLDEEGTENEYLGYLMFFQLDALLPDAQCGHCHSGPLLGGNNSYFNNGLEAVNDLNAFPDKGLGAITNNPNDNGKFRAPSLRNIALTAPYMHDGRFQTLEEVLDHYGSGGHYSPNVDPFMLQLVQKPLNASDKASVIKFLHTLTDSTFAKNPDFQNPF